MELEFEFPLSISVLELIEVMVSVEVDSSMLLELFMELLSNSICKSA